MIFSYKEVTQVKGDIVEIHADLTQTIASIREAAEKMYKPDAPLDEAREALKRSIMKAVEMGFEVPLDMDERAEFLAERLSKALMER